MTGGAVRSRSSAPGCIPMDVGGTQIHVPCRHARIGPCRSPSGGSIMAFIASRNRDIVGTRKAGTSMTVPAGRAFRDRTGAVVDYTCHHILGTWSMTHAARTPASSTSPVGGVEPGHVVPVPMAVPAVKAGMHVSRLIPRMTARVGAVLDDDDLSST